MPKFRKFFPIATVANPLDLQKLLDAPVQSWFVIFEDFKFGIFERPDDIVLEPRGSVEEFFIDVPSTLRKSDVVIFVPEGEPVTVKNSLFIAYLRGVISREFAMQIASYDEDRSVPVSDSVKAMHAGWSQAMACMPERAPKCLQWDLAVSLWEALSETSAEFDETSTEVGKSCRHLECHMVDAVSSPEIFEDAKKRDVAVVMVTNMITGETTIEVENPEGFEDVLQELAKALDAHGFTCDEETQTFEGKIEDFDEFRALRSAVSSIVHNRGENLHPLSRLPEILEAIAEGKEVDIPGVIVIEL